MKAWKLTFNDKCVYLNEAIDETIELNLLRKRSNQASMMLVVGGSLSSKFSVTVDTLLSDDDRMIQHEKAVVKNQINLQYNKIIYKRVMSLQLFSNYMNETDCHIMVETRFIKYCLLQEIDNVKFIKTNHI